MSDKVNLIPFWAFSVNAGAKPIIFTDYYQALKARRKRLLFVATEWAAYCNGMEKIQIELDDEQPRADEYPTTIIKYPVGIAKAEDWGYSGLINWSAHPADQAVQEAVTTPLMATLDQAHARIAQLEAELAELKSSAGSTLLDLLVGEIPLAGSLFAERADDGFLYEDCKAWWSNEYLIDEPPPGFVIHGEALDRLRKFGHNKQCGLAVIDALNGSVSRMITLFEHHCN